MRAGLPVSCFAAAAGALCLLAVGCVPFVPVGYAYPTVSVVPPVRVGPAADDVYAFRVDIADENNCIDFADKDRYVLRALCLSPGHSSYPQMQVSVDYGWIWNCIALIYTGHTSHTVRVRLYRPGWQTVEVKSWQRQGKADWREAPDAEGREKAVDDLVSTWETDFSGRRFGQGDSEGRSQGPALFACLTSGHVSRSHREALLFAAAEYERLLAEASPESAGKMRERLAAKAKALRELAAK
jgi:hypothetical protein